MRRTPIPGVAHVDPTSETQNDENQPITKVTKILARTDASEVKIVAQAYVGLGLHRSIGVDVFHRESPDHNWKLCCDRPHPDWRTMSVDEYVKHGRSEMLQVASPGEILAVINLIGKPLAELHQGAAQSEAEITASLNNEDTIPDEGESFAPSEAEPSGPGMSM